MSFQDWVKKIGAVEVDDVVAYYSSVERVHLELSVVNGLIFDATNKLVDTSHIKSSSKEMSSVGFVDCVLSLDEKLYCYGTDAAISAKKDGEHRHSGILEAGAVRFAGELRIEQGKITEITLRTGHYRSTEKHLYNFLKFLHKAGIDLNGVILHQWSHTPLSENALKWFEDFGKTDRDDTKFHA